MRILKYVLYVLLLAGFFINLGLLLIAISSPYISPRFFWPPAAVTLFFKVFLGLHIIFFVILVLLRRVKWAMLGAVVIILSIPCVRKSFAMNFSARTVSGNEADSCIRLMTYNVHSFTWHEDTVEMNKILENIRSQKPDILCLQEYYMHPHKHKRILNFFRKDLKLTNYYEYVTDMLPGHNKVGLAIFSRYPFSNFTPIRFEKTSNGAFYADMKLGKDTIRLINVHFQSVSLSEREYTLPGQKAKGDTLDVPRERLTQISLRKFRNAFRKRSYQVQLVKELTDSSPYKVVLCGDFNDIPTSYLYEQLTRNLDDTFLKTNFGTGTTFAGKIPGLRIDYVLADPEIPVVKTYVVKEKAGDHYPLVCLIKSASQ
jgi:endonuclease/exonuclease/phosphatase family metal-dependent hydrolase